MPLRANSDMKRSSRELERERECYICMYINKQTTGKSPKTTESVRPTEVVKFAQAFLFLLSRSSLFSAWYYRTVGRTVEAEAGCPRGRCCQPFFSCCAIVALSGTRAAGVKRRCEPCILYAVRVLLVVSRMMMLSLMVAVSSETADSTKCKEI